MSYHRYTVNRTDAESLQHWKRQANREASALDSLARSQHGLSPFSRLYASLTEQRLECAARYHTACCAVGRILIAMAAAS